MTTSGTIQLYTIEQIPTNRECRIVKMTSTLDGSVVYSVDAYSRQKTFTPEQFEAWINKKYWSFSDLI